MCWCKLTEQLDVATPSLISMLQPSHVRPRQQLMLVYSTVLEPLSGALHTTVRRATEQKRTAHQAGTVRAALALFTQQHSSAAPTFHNCTTDESAFSAPLSTSRSALSHQARHLIIVADRLITPHYPHITARVVSITLAVSMSF